MNTAIHELGHVLGFSSGAYVRSAVCGVRGVVRVCVGCGMHVDACEMRVGCASVRGVCVCVCVVVIVGGLETFYLATNVPNRIVQVSYVHGDGMAMAQLTLVAHTEWTPLPPPTHTPSPLFRPVPLVSERGRDAADAGPQRHGLHVRGGGARDS